MIDHYSSAMMRCANTCFADYVEWHVWGAPEFVLLSPLTPNTLWLGLKKVAPRRQGGWMDGVRRATNTSNYLSQSMCEFAKQQAKPGDAHLAFVGGPLLVDWITTTKHTVYQQLIREYQLQTAHRDKAVPQQQSLQKTSGCKQRIAWGEMFMVRIL